VDGVVRGMQKRWCKRQNVDRTAGGFTSHSKIRPARLTVPRLASLGEMQLRPACQLGLATTPKLTGGHDVARGPDLIVGFAFTPCVTLSQWKSWVFLVRHAVKAAARPGLSREISWEISSLLMAGVNIWPRCRWEAMKKRGGNRQYEDLKDQR
jgi:hypothetical protein